MKLGRNDLCLCGSGKKYKTCCLKNIQTQNEVWQNNFFKLTSDVEKQELVKDIFYLTYQFMKKHDWQGACHTISSIQYILLSEVGLTPTLCTGVVNTAMGMFDHSWIELNNKVYDITIENSLNGEFSKSIIANCNIMSLEETNFIYGTGMALDIEANLIVQSNLTSYLDGFSSIPTWQKPNFLKNGLWDLIINLGNNLNLNLDIQELRDKYSLIYRTVK